MGAISRRLAILRGLQTLTGGTAIVGAGRLMAATPGFPETEPARADVAHSGGLLLSVALPKSHGKRHLQAGGPFDTVVTNLSPEPIRVWRDWCSWGYFNLSLEFRSGERTWLATKKVPIWTINYPDEAELAAGESIVFKVVLNEDWQDLPPWDEFIGNVLEMRVLYAIEEDKQSTEIDVWLGKMATAWQTYDVVV